MTCFSAAERALLAIAMSVLSFTASAASFTYTVIDAPKAGSSYVIGITKSGKVLGAWYDKYDLPHGFIYDQKEKFRTIDYPGADYTHVTAISDRGVVVGDYQFPCPNCENHGFIYSGGKFTTYDAPNSMATFLTGINRSGLIAGYASVSSSNFENQAFTLSPSGTYTPFLNGYEGTLVSPTGVNTSGAVAGDNAFFSYLYANGTITPGPFETNTFTLTAGVNRGGTVAGSYYSPSTGIAQGFTYTGQNLSSISGPGASATFVEGINDAGAVVGSYYTTNDLIFTGFVYQGGVFTTISPPNAATTSPFCINDSGVIGGSFSTGSMTNSHVAAFIATPSN